MLTGLQSEVRKRPWSYQRSWADLGKIIEMRLVLISLLLASAASAQCLSFSNFQGVGTLPTNVTPVGALWEVSGVEASRLNPDVLWVHDDKGNGPYLTAITEAGVVRRRYFLSGVSNVDWEDLAIGPGPTPGRDYLYVGDIGDNSASGSIIALLRVPEPQVPAGTSSQVDLLQGVETFTCQYPLSRGHDAETLLVDPVDGRPYILTKEGSGSVGYLYGYPMPLDSSLTKTLVLEATFSHSAPKFSGGDVSPDGRNIYVRNGSTIYAYPRADGASFASAFGGVPCTLRGNNQGNAEALTVRPDGTTLIAVSEGQAGGIYKSQGTLPSSRTVVPSWWSFGTGLAGAQGVPDLGLLEAPVLGRNALSFGSWSAPSNAAGLLLLSTTSYVDGQVMFRGGWLHAGADILLSLTYGASGTAQLTLGVIPDVAALYGVRLHAQALVIDSTAIQGVGMSPGVTLQLDH